MHFKLTFEFLLKFLFKSNIFSFPQPIGALYIRNFFDEPSMQPVHQLFESFREEIIKTFQTASWLDGQTRFAAIEKAKDLIVNIAYPDELNGVEPKFSNLKYEPNQLFWISAAQIHLKPKNYFISLMITHRLNSELQDHLAI